MPERASGLDMKPPNVTCVAGVLTLLFSMALTAAAQQTTPWEGKLCKEDPGACGIIVTFRPPIRDALLVPNEVTVDVPLELHATRVIVQSYPLGTGGRTFPRKVLRQCTGSTKSVSTHASEAKSTNVLSKQVSKFSFSAKALSATR